MQQTHFNAGHRATPSALLSLTHPNKELFQRHRALLRKSIPAGFPSPLPTTMCSSASAWMNT